MGKKVIKLEGLYCFKNLGIKDSMSTQIGPLVSNLALLLRSLKFGFSTGI